MRFGIHLPQYGRSAGPDSIRDSARQAEDLGFASVWVSDHLGVPDGAPYPPAFIYEPLITLTWAAAVTTRVELGTSVLVLPYRRPLHLAKELASLDQLSGGRLVLGAAPGWLEGEFDALGVPFAERGVRTDETIAALRACWEQRVVDYQGSTVAIQGMRVVPQPARRVPIWIGGTSAVALRRAASAGDGWHAMGLSPEEIAPLVDGLRRQRPDDFVVSLRVTWDGLAPEAKGYRDEIDAYARAGVDQLIAAPSQSDPDSWRRSVAALAEIFELAPAG